MENKYKLFLLVPVLILALATYLLVAGEVLLRQAAQQPVRHQAAGTPDRPASSIALQDALKSNRESAYPYFLLGAGLLVALVVLPRLGEFSFSPSSGFSLKLLEEVKAAIEEVKTTTQAVIHKTNQDTHLESIKSIVPQRASLSAELTSLEASQAKLEAYATVLEKVIATKGK